MEDNNKEIFKVSVDISQFPVNFFFFLLVLLLQVLLESSQLNIITGETESNAGYA